MIGLWNTDTGIVSGESGMFFEKNPVKLLFPAEKILNISCPAKGKVYRAGVDYLHESGSDLIFLTDASEIPVLPLSMITPAPENAIRFPEKNANAISNSEKGLLLFDGKDFFARNQVEIDYQISGTPAFPQNRPLSSGVLPRFRQKLKNGDPITINLIGDSISEGYNATGFLNVPPFAKQYTKLFAEGLEKQFGCKIDFRNRAIGGTGCLGAASIEDRWLETPCDLQIIAYGMNDLCGLTADRFQAALQDIINRKHACTPETEFLLIASMPGNPNWYLTPFEASEKFAETICSMETETVGVADVFHFWTWIQNRKNYYDLTGNGVNHPNDYGHRIYAAILLDLFSR